MNTASETGSMCGRWLLPFCLGMGLLPVATGAQGETLFKCQGADGVASYQSAPCAEAAQQVWQREVTPEPEPAAPRNRAPSPAHTVNRTRAVRVRSARAAAPHANACARARAAADDERDRRWYTITFDRLRELDEQVARACKKS
ncbi:MAG: hypothetical protein CVV14_12955 [Gammaproteobacteria bacterium HGW-Gammaproteobacteria-4]|jgi:hypothetical protein|nr:MAG: hypothetical protein CVV14_12955 [Gammaproteobacteria bacterium HGW-Gammaproteobacteria-4]